MTRFQGWADVAGRLGKLAEDRGYISGDTNFLNRDQRLSLEAISHRLPQHGLILADEVGMGKTRIAVALARAVIECGGRVAIVVPPGLANQWTAELRDGKVEIQGEMLRSLWSFYGHWVDKQNLFNPWAKNKVQIISQNFANWQNRSTDNDEIACQNLLLPALYAIYTNKLRSKYHPAAEHTWDSVWHQYSLRAAASIAQGMGKRQLRTITKSGNFKNWKKQSNYEKGSENRRALHQAIGRGLGKFDLVIIDEAHKNRSNSGNLSILLDEILWTTVGTRHLGMTATPVEIELEQWEQSLARVGIDRATIEKDIKRPIEIYAKTITELRTCWRTNDAILDDYEVAAKSFQDALSPYLLRRDKREDPIVQKYIGLANKNVQKSLDYRNVKPIKVEFESLESNWKKAVVAAEALSCMVQSDQGVKRLRLTIGNGHGVANIMGSFTKSKLDVAQREEDKYQDRRSGQNSQHESLSSIENDQVSKSIDRSVFWKNLYLKAAGTNDPEIALLRHPAIKAAAFEINALPEDEKVLVFGRFTAPIRALTLLLNVQAIIQSVDGNGFWPHADLTEMERRAFRDLYPERCLNILTEHLKSGMRNFENRRARARRFLEQETTHASLQNSKLTLDRKIASLLEFSLLTETFSSLVRNVAEALPNEICGDENDRIIAILREIVSPMLVADDTSDNEQDDEDEFAEHIWENLSEQLEAEYGDGSSNVPRSAYARMLVGGTDFKTRKYLQAAFNNNTRFPRVLVAQSLVGREGLNLHTACRTVILLHLEWNPGVVEQQIGRVDRINSRWSNLLNDYEQGLVNEIPQINIRPVIFEETYDEGHWSVLQARWQDLRAQLHGDIIPPSECLDLTKEEMVKIEQLQRVAPNFSPSSFKLG